MYLNEMHSFHSSKFDFCEDFRFISVQEQNATVICRRSKVIQDDYQDAPVKNNPAV